ncbi:MAG TPA: hypothetical protein PKY81_15370 [bacterium]|nr:hypothetical protein [bacterium]
MKKQKTEIGNLLNALSDSDKSKRFESLENLKTKIDIIDFFDEKGIIDKLMEFVNCQDIEIEEFTSDILCLFTDNLKEKEIRAIKNRIDELISKKYKRKIVLMKIILNYLHSLKLINYKPEYADIIFDIYLYKESEFKNDLSYFERFKYEKAPIFFKYKFEDYINDKKIEIKLRYEITDIYAHYLKLSGKRNELEKFIIEKLKSEDESERIIGTAAVGVCPKKEYILQLVKCTRKEGLKIKDSVDDLFLNTVAVFALKNYSVNDIQKAVFSDPLFDTQKTNPLKINFGVEYL